MSKYLSVQLLGLLVAWTWGQQSGFTSAVYTTPSRAEKQADGSPLHKSSSNALSLGSQALHVTIKMWNSRAKIPELDASGSYTGDVERATLDGSPQVLGSCLMPTSSSPNLHVGSLYRLKSTKDGLVVFVAKQLGLMLQSLSCMCLQTVAMQRNSSTQKTCANAFLSG